jgi:hypothetical protein
MYKVKYVVMLFFIFVMSINAHSQRNIVHNLIVSDTMQYLIVDYPEEFSWLVMSAFIFPTISMEKPIENGYYMFFIVDSNIILQYISKTKDAELYAKYNPIQENNNSYTIGKATKRMKKREFAILIHQELEKQLIVSVNVKEKGIYVYKSFKP